MQKTKFNIVDFLIILILLLIVAIGIWYFSNIGDGHAIYTYFIVEITNMDPDFSELVAHGDPIRDAVRNYFLGYVVNVEAVPAVLVTFDAINEQFITQNIPERYDIYITIRGNGSQTASSITTEGHQVRVGQEVFIRGRGYAGSGFLTNLWVENRN